MGSRTLQTPQDPILLLPWLSFRGGGVPTLVVGEDRTLAAVNVSGFCGRCPQNSSCREASKPSTRRLSSSCGRLVSNASCLRSRRGRVDASAVSATVSVHASPHSHHTRVARVREGKRFERWPPFRPPRLLGLPPSRIVRTAPPSIRTLNGQARTTRRGAHLATQRPPSGELRTLRICKAKMPTMAISTSVVPVRRTGLACKNCAGRYTATA